MAGYIFIALHLSLIFNLKLDTGGTNHSLAIKV